MGGEEKKEPRLKWTWSMTVERRDEFWIASIERGKKERRDERKEGAGRDSHKLT